MTADLSPYEVSVAGGSVAVNNTASGDNERELLYSDGQTAVRDPYAAHVPLGTTAVVDQIVVDGKHCQAGGC